MNKYQLELLLNYIDLKLNPELDTVNAMGWSKSESIKLSLEVSCED